MIETKEVVIDGKAYKLRCSILTTEHFEKLTGKKFGKVLSQYLQMSKLIEQGNDDFFELYTEIQGDMIRLAYCMIQENDPEFTKTCDEFMSEVGALDTETLKGVLSVAQGLFPRKVQQRANGSGETTEQG